MSDVKLTAVDTTALPWEERPNEKIGRSLYRKNLIVDPDTGMEVRLVRYPAGIVNPLHTHPCAHGMYVLEGILVAHDGQYGPGHFVFLHARNCPSPPAFMGRQSRGKGAWPGLLLWSAAT
jgi:glyoxylate utilization-related uncharacterized protein